MRKLLCFVMATACMLGCNGNGPNRSEIRGNVSLDGVPLENGSILFTPIDGTDGLAAGGRIEQGNYQLTAANGPTVGWNRVEIRGMRKTGKKLPKPFAPPGEMIDEMVEAVPPKYNSLSTMKVEVKPTENIADFDLESK